MSVSLENGNVSYFSKRTVDALRVMFREFFPESSVVHVQVNQLLDEGVETVISVSFPWGGSYTVSCPMSEGLVKVSLESMTDWQKSLVKEAFSFFFRVHSHNVCQVEHLLPYGAFSLDWFSHLVGLSVYLMSHDGDIDRIVTVVKTRYYFLRDAQATLSVLNRVIEEKKAGEVDHFRLTRRECHTVDAILRGVVHEFYDSDDCYWDATTLTYTKEHYTSQ